MQENGHKQQKKEPNDIGWDVLSQQLNGNHSPKRVRRGTHITRKSNERLAHKEHRERGVQQYGIRTDKVKNTRAKTGPKQTLLRSSALQNRRQSSGRGEIMSVKIAETNQENDGETMGNKKAQWEK